MRRRALKHFKQKPTAFVLFLVCAAFVGMVGGTLASVAILNRYLPSVGNALVETSLSLGNRADQTVGVVNEVVPAVVSIVIKKTNNSDPEAVDSLVAVGGGTGFFVDDDGLIVTNRHVVSDMEASYTIVTNNGAEWPAIVVARDPLLDIAMMRVETKERTFPKIFLGDSDALRIGETVIAVGNTLSEFPNTVTKGIVSGMNRHVWAGDLFGSDAVIERAIQTDAAINLGNSGGPLVNLRGEVVGVNTAISMEGEAVGFAIPINEVKKAITDVEQYGRIVRPWLGVRYVVVDAALAKAKGLAYDFGALVSVGTKQQPGVVPDSPAEDGGIKGGDVIVSINGTTLKNGRTLGQFLSDRAPGDKVTLQISRNDKILMKEIVLGEFPSSDF